ncbi:MAG: hypothetical protein E7087_01715 [Bacteroidales bacterium]|nr:hypothetical protein [Bacteroidales bacterium]
MYTVQEIIELDSYLLHTVNGSNSTFLEGCIAAYVTPFVWVPLLLVLLYVLMKNNTFANFITIIALIAAMLGVSFLLTTYALQPLSLFLRDAHDGEMMSVLNALNGYRASNGSLLTLAAGVTSLACFLMLLVRHTALSVSLVLWAGINCFAGVYMAVFYPWDVVAGILLGVLCGTVAYGMFDYLQKKQRVRRDWVSNRYTKSGYEVPDVYLVLVFMYATFAAVPIISFFILPH